MAFERTYVRYFYNLIFIVGGGGGGGDRATLGGVKGNF